MKTEISSIRKELKQKSALYKGISSPFYTGYGTFSIAEDSLQGINQTASLIQTAFLDCSSANPFEELGLDFSILFTNNNPNEMALVEMKILELMQEFADRLEVRGIKLKSNPEKGTIDVNMTVYYIPLDREVELSGLILGGGNG